MRGIRAKHLKRLVYGEQSQKQERDYIRTEKGTIIGQGLRRLYQELKARYKGRR